MLVSGMVKKKKNRSRGTFFWRVAPILVILTLRLLPNSQSVNVKCQSLGDPGPPGPPKCTIKHQTSGGILMSTRWAPYQLLVHLFSAIYNGPITPFTTIVGAHLVGNVTFLENLWWRMRMDQWINHLQFPFLFSVRLDQRPWIWTLGVNLEMDVV